MSTPILVTYATRYGSTQEVAEAVAGTLCEQGLAVDLQPVEDVHTLDGYQAVVLGAPFYIGRWHKDALEFLATHHETLAERLVAVFALGPLHDDAQEFQAVRAVRSRAGQIPLADAGRVGTVWRHVRPGEAALCRPVDCQFAGQPAAWDAGRRRAGLDGDPCLGDHLAAKLQPAVAR